MLEKIKDKIIIFVPLLVGILASLLVDFNIYNEINLPPVAPPSILFPIVWTILYLLIGISYYILRKDGSNKENSILFYAQLIINFIWVLCFFDLKLFLVCFILIIVLDFIVLYMILTYYRYNKVSSFLLIPYFIWLVFATYLNWTIYLIN